MKKKSNNKISTLSDFKSLSLPCLFWSSGIHPRDCWWQMKKEEQIFYKSLIPILFENVSGQNLKLCKTRKYVQATSICVGMLFNTLVLTSSFYIFHWFNIFSIFLKIIKPLISSVQLLSRVQAFATPWIAACQTSLSITSSQSLLKLMSIVLVMPSNHLILCRPLLLPPSIFPSIRVFSNESVLGIR